MIDDIYTNSLDHEKSKNKFPFGNPDGSKAELGNSINRFVQLDERQFSSGISATETDRNIRVIVGKKGAGKTVYIRRLQDSARREKSISSDADANIFASKISKDIPTTESVMGFCQLFDAEKVTEAWQTAWRIAILRSVVSHLVHKKFFRDYINQSDLISKIEALGELPNRASVERSPYTELKDIISEFRNEKLFFRFGGSSKWDELQTILGSVLKDCPPIFLYMDASDDEFAHAPMDWHRCQKGLFYAVMKLLDQSGAIGARFHAVIAIRDIVYSSVLQSEHRTRYINSPSICLLDWDYHSIRYFLEQKLLHVAGDHFDDPEKRTIGSFLSVDNIENSRRECVENPMDYLIRHTRGLPRDIIQLGNRIASEKIQHRARATSPERWVKGIKATISSMARTFADEQLAICAHQLASHDAPSHSARHQYSELYTSNKEYISFRLDTMKTYLSSLRKERITRDELFKADQEFQSKVPNGVRLSTILWQNGLIGTRQHLDDENFQFYSLSNNSDFILPDFGSDYALHSIVLDLIPSLELVFSRPVSEAL